MKILVCSTGFLPAQSFGGLPFSTYNLCKGLSNAGADVRVITTNCNGGAPLDVSTDCWTVYDGIAVWYAATRGGPFLFGPSAGKAIRDTMPTVDCVINSATLWSHSGLVSWRAAKRYRRPSLTYVRGLLDPWALNYKPLRKSIYWNVVGRRILRESTVVIALTERERAFVRSMCLGTRIEVIPNGASLDAEAQSFPRQRLDDVMPELSGRRYVLFLGRIHAKKGLDILMKAAPELFQEVQDVAVVVAGPVDASYAAQWDDLRRTCPLERRIITPGAVKEPLKTILLRHAEVFVLPSYGEGLPVAALEALLAGCPVVVTRQCNLPEVQEAGAGIVIDPDPDQLAKAMRILLLDNTLRCAMAEKASTLAATHFRWDAIARRTLALCREVATCSAISLATN